MKNPDVIVVGAGFSGAVIAERFARVADKSVLVLEQRAHIGGNCYDFKNDDGIIVHQYGPHLFHTNNVEVWDYLSQFTQWHSYEHKVLSSIDGQLVPLPFNLNTLYRLYDAGQAKDIEALLIANYGEGSKVPILELKQSDEPLLQSLGQLVYEKFFVNYTVKQWGCKPEDIAPSVTARVPVIISRDDRYFHDAYQAMPVNGYTSMFERMLSHKNITVELNCEASARIKLDPRSNVISFDGQPFTGQLVYTGTLDGLFDYLYGELPYRSLIFKYERLGIEKFQPATTVNYPNEEEFTRITEFKNIIPVKSANTVIVREYPDDFDRHDPERNIPYYPIFTDENRHAHSVYQRLANEFKNLTVLGRLADYKYYNMDDAIANAINCFETIRGS